VSEDDPGEFKCTPTDPNIEFDVFEVVRLRLVEALASAGHGLVGAERVALYVVGCARDPSPNS